MNQTHEWQSIELTPAMLQFKEIKLEHPDCVLFFRMGDFYEMFFEDAELASKVLGITLTKRGEAPLAGVPYYTGEENINKVVSSGYKVAVCEQLEDPKLVKNRVVKRGVVRIVTPGTITSPQSLDGKSNNYIAAILNNKSKFALSFADLTTGMFNVAELSKKEIVHEILKLNPSEIICRKDDSVFFPELLQNKFFSYLSDDHFSYHATYKRLIHHFQVDNLEGFGIERSDVQIQSAGGLLSYLYKTQKGQIGQMKSLQIYNSKKHLSIDRTTIRNLELFHNIRDGTSRGSLISVIDKTVTNMGARLLRYWIQYPLMNIAKIRERHDSVEELLNESLVREDLRELLKNVYDIERLLTKMNNGTANPKDVLAMRDSLLLIPRIQERVKYLKSPLFSEFKKIDPLNELSKEISRAICDNPPIRLTEGGIVRDGYSKDLDELREIMRGGKKFIMELESREKKLSGISTLKIGFNKVHGYYIDITRRFAEKVPDRYIRKQTLANSERYVTPELKEMEEKIIGAEEKLNYLEHKIFTELVIKIVSKTKEIQNIASQIAISDAIVALSKVAVMNNYAKPEMHEGYELILRESRHPVIELTHPEPYVPNSIGLYPDSRLLIITGPNMSGKSSFMRQVSLIQILAQIGSFIPASYAKIGIVDKIFTRVGAYDDLTMGQSTFMVEMTETAYILHNVSSRSLVIMDEIGRGTSTFDGISLAWAIAEKLYSSGAKTLFATHYHQLNKLENEFDGVKNYTVSVKEKDDEVIFLRKIIQGSTDRSYGVYVAKLAGLPNSVIERSRKIMTMLEMEDKIASSLHAPLKKEKEEPVFIEDIDIEEDLDKEIKGAKNVTGAKDADDVKKVKNAKTQSESKDVSLDRFM